MNCLCMASVSWGFCFDSGWKQWENLSKLTQSATNFKQWSNLLIITDNKNNQSECELSECIRVTWRCPAATADSSPSLYWRAWVSVWTEMTSPNHCDESMLLTKHHRLYPHYFELEQIRCSSRTPPCYCLAVDIYKTTRQQHARHTTESEQLAVQVVFSKRVYLVWRFILPHSPPQLSYDLFLPFPSLSFTTWGLVFTTAAAMSLIRGLVSTLYYIPKIYKWFYRPYYLLSLLMTLAFPLVRRCPGLCEHLPSQREDNNSCAFDWVSAAAQRHSLGKPKETVILN